MVLFHTFSLLPDWCVSAASSFCRNPDPDGRPDPLYIIKNRNLYPFNTLYYRRTETSFQMVLLLGYYSYCMYCSIPDSSVSAASRFCRNPDPDGRPDGP